jgi:small-conductance mechanosensitive channel
VVLFSFVKTYLPILFKNIKPNDHRFKRWVYISEFVLVIAALIVFVSYVASKNSVIAIVLMAVLLMAFYFLSVYFVKDYLVGLIIKSSGEYRLGDQISVEQASGRIAKLGRTQLKVKDTAGNTVYIPYSWLKSRVKTVQQKTDKINGYTFNVDIKQASIDDDQIQNIVRKIKLLPWVHPAFEPMVDVSTKQVGELELKITVYAFDKAFHSKIESVVRANLVA